MTVGEPEIVPLADKVATVTIGKIAEEGHHDDLVKDGGLYAEMFELQAANYR